MDVAHVTLIAIVEDEAFARFGLRKAIEEVAGFKILFEAINGEDFFRQLEQSKLQPDIITLDPVMPIMDGEAVQRVLRKKYPHIKVLTVSGSDHLFTIERSIVLGARGYLLKPDCNLHVEQAIKNIMEQGYYYSEVADKKVFERVHNIPFYTHPISPREKEVLINIYRGYSYKEMIALMHVSEETIKGYKKTLCEKLRLHSKEDLILFALKNEIYPPPHI